MTTIDPDQLPMFPAAVSSKPTGWWADAGRYMVGEAEEMPVVPPVLLAARELGSAAVARGGELPSMAFGAGLSPGQTGASHARGPQEAL